MYKWGKRVRRGTYPSTPCRAAAYLDDMPPIHIFILGIPDPFLRQRGKEYICRVELLFAPNPDLLRSPAYQEYHIVHYSVLTTFSPTSLISLVQDKFPKFLL